MIPYDTMDVDEEYAEERWCPVCEEYVKCDPAQQPLDVCPECGKWPL